MKKSTLLSRTYRSGSNNDKLCRTYLDGGDYVGAAAAAAGKLHLGLAELSRLSGCFRAASNPKAEQTKINLEAVMMC